MLILKAYKTKLRVNNKERSLLRRCTGTARFVFNWALADRIERYKAGKSTTYYEQKKRFNALKHTEFPWVTEVPYKITDSAFRNLDAAYQNFFRRVKNGVDKPGFPKFKSRSYGIGSFTVRGNIKVEYGRVRLPVIGWLRLAEKGYLPTGSIKIMSATASEKASYWYVSLNVEEAVAEPERATGEPIGVDLGIKTLAVCSDGTTFENPAALRQYERKLARLQRELSRRKKGGRNWKKSKAKIAKVYRKIANIRKHASHNVSRHVTVNTRPAIVVLENLNVAGMLKNHCLAKSISDASFSELRRQIEYKAGWNGVQVQLADRFYPSSKRCSECGVVKKLLLLSERMFVCSECGCVLDRDLNAAKNLVALVLEPVNDGELPVELVLHQGPTVKQEVGISNV